MSMPEPPLPPGQLNDKGLNAQYQAIIALYVAGKYNEAVPRAEELLKSIEGRFGEDTSPYAAAISVLARLCQAQGRYTEAEEYVKRALDIDQRVVRADHPNIASDLGALGQLYQVQGRLDEAEPLMKKSLAITEAARKADPVSLGRALNNLAWLYQEKGRYAEAEPLVKRSLSLIEKARGSKDEDYGRALDTLAKLYERQGRLKDAEPLYRRAVAILVAARGSDFEGVAESQENLGGLLKSQGKLDEAEPLLKQALATKERVFGSTHPNLVSSLSLLGDLHRLQGKADSAEPLFKRLLEIHKAAVREIPVYFATDRKQDKDAKAIGFSGESSDDGLTFGQATVIVDKPEIAPSRTLSNAPLPNGEQVSEALHIETTEVSHLTKSKVTVADERVIMDEAQKRLDSARVFPKQVFVFVHGFHVSFENSLCRAAQIAYDLNFDGAAFLFTWPSGDGVLSYFRTNQENEKIAADHLAEFLEKIAASTNATKIHVIAHSMGNTVLLDALDKLSGKRSNLRLAEIVMHSPDVGSNRFRQVMTTIKGIGAGETLYASTKDRALGLSGWISGEKAGGTASVFPGVETIDVTAAGSTFLGLNHDIYATNPTIFNDMRLVLELGTHPPDKRSALFQPKAAYGGTYWLYRPPEVASVDKIVGLPAAALRAHAPSVAVSPAPSSEPISQSSPAPGAKVTTASIAKPPKTKFKRKRPRPDFDPDWNTNPLH
jgi:esterase/lipase superfamily enzyme